MRIELPIGLFLSAVPMILVGIKNSSSARLRSMILGSNCPRVDLSEEVLNLLPSEHSHTEHNGLPSILRAFPHRLESLNELEPQVWILVNDTHDLNASGN